MRWALAASATVHLGVGMLWLAGPVPRGADEVLPIEVELVQQAAMQQGGSPTQGGPASAPADPAPPETADASRPPPSPPVPPARAAAPSVNLGDGPRDFEGLSVTGENVVPPEPDAAFRNRPPSYPAAAARARAEGTVQLVIHVSEVGVPEQVAIGSSSGHPLLDRAARDAVLQWRFRPALSAGAPVAFDYVINIRFSLGDQ